MKGEREPPPPPPPANGRPAEEPTAAEADAMAEAEARRIRTWSEEASTRLEGVRRQSDLPPPPPPDPDDWPLVTRLGCVLPTTLVMGALIATAVSRWGLPVVGQATIILGMVAIFVSFAWMWGSVGVYAVTVAPFLDIRRSVKPVEALAGFVLHFATSLGVAGRIFLAGFVLMLVGGVLKAVGAAG